MTFVGLYQDMTVVCGFPSNVAMSILGDIASMLMTVFRAFGLSTMPTPPIVLLPEFFHDVADMKVQPFPVL